MKQGDRRSGRIETELTEEILPHRRPVVTRTPYRDAVGDRDRLPVHAVEDVDVIRPVKLAVQAIGDASVVIAGGYQHGLGRQPLELACDETARVEGDAIVLVQIAAHRDGVHIALEGQINDSAQGSPELFAAPAGFTRRHADASE